MRGWYTVGVVLWFRSEQRTLEPKRHQAHMMNHCTLSNDKRPRKREERLAQHLKQRRGSDVCIGGSLLVPPTAYLSYQLPRTRNTLPQRLQSNVGQPRSKIALVDAS